MNDRAWVQFTIPQKEHYNPFGQSEMIVVRDQNTLYYFANSVAWCLGKDFNPHEFIQKHHDKGHTLDWISGIFLKEDGVRELATHSIIKTSFLTWFDDYYKQCNTSSKYPCP